MATGQDGLPTLFLEVGRGFGCLADIYIRMNRPVCVRPNVYFPVSPTSSVSIVDRARRPTKTRREEREEKMCVYILMEVTNRGKSTTGAIIFERPCDGIQVSPLSSSVRREAGGIASKVFPSKGERTLFLKKLLVDLMRNEKGGPSISLSHV